MKTKKRKTGSYRCDPRAMERTVGRVGPFTRAEITALLIPGRVALEAMRTGQGTEEDFHTLASAANITLVRSEQIKAQLCIDVSKTGMDALMRAIGRHDTTKRWGLDGPALADISTMLELYEQFVEKGSPQQFADALREVMRRMYAGDVLANT